MYKGPIDNKLLKATSQIKNVVDEHYKIALDQLGHLPDGDQKKQLKSLLVKSKGGKVDVGKAIQQLNKICRPK